MDNVAAEKWKKKSIQFCLDIDIDLKFKFVDSVLEFSF